MKKTVFLKTFIETRWCHRFRSKEALKRYQDKQLARYHAFITSQSPYFQTHSPESFGTMDKSFMMAHFNELNTLGVDRDQALEMAIRGEQTRDFTEMNGEVAVGLSFWDFRPPRSFCHHRKREKYVGCSDSSQDATERKTLWSSHCLFLTSGQ